MLQQYTYTLSIYSITFHSMFTVTYLLCILHFSASNQSTVPTTQTEHCTNAANNCFDKICSWHGTLMNFPHSSLQSERQFYHLEGFHSFKWRGFFVVLLNFYTCSYLIYPKIYILIFLTLLILDYQLNWLKKEDKIVVNGGDGQWNVRMFVTSGSYTFIHEVFTAQWRVHAHKHINTNIYSTRTRLYSLFSAFPRRRLCAYNRVTKYCLWKSFAYLQV